MGVNRLTAEGRLTKKTDIKFQLMQLKLPGRRKLLVLSLALALVAVVVAGYLLGVQNVFYTSKAQVFLDGQQVVATFTVVPKDRENVEQFSRNLGLEEDFTRGIAVSLDEQSVSFLKNFLPKEINLRIRPKSIEFGAQLLAEDELLLSATGEGSFKVQDFGGGSFEVEIDNPEQVLSSATRSGKLRLSQGALDRSLWQMLSKLAKIKVSVDGHTLWGVVVLH